MRTMMLAVTMAATTALAGAASVRAEAPEPRCLMPSHTWDNARPVAAGGTVSGLPTLSPGRAVMVGLVDAEQVRFAAPLGKPVAPGDKGGLVALHVAAAGTYRVAIQHKAWIDLVRSGKALASVAHAHGAPCSGIAKTVDFALPPGDYMIQLSDSADETIGVLVTKQP